MNTPFVLFWAGVAALYASAALAFANLPLAAPVAIIALASILLSIFLEL